MAGTDRRQKLIMDGPVIILVNPQLGENIGASARAMANFGLAELRLVDPRDGWPNEVARANAAKADHIIDGVQVFDTLEEALADLNFVYATTARQREMLKPVRDPATACATLRQRHGRGERVGILFGRERWGLESVEVALADGRVPWSEAALAQLRQDGKPVFVDVTADWCITCLANENAVLFTDAMTDAFNRHGVVYMVADWTNYDADIARFISSHGRTGIPLYLMYPANTAEQPMILPQILTSDTVIQALEAVSGKKNEVSLTLTDNSR